MATTALTRPKPKRLWTYDEMVAEWPETNLPVELWNGEVIMSPAPSPDHQEIVLNFAQRLKTFVSAAGLGKVYVSPLDVVLTQRRVVQPDVFFIAKDRLGIVKQHIAGAPDLVVEVVSRESRRRDRVEKKTLYEQFGLPEYWLIDPEGETIDVFVLVKGVYQLHCRTTGAQTAKSKLLTGFSVTFKELSA